MSARTNGKTTGKTTGELIPQRHGGALRNGGTNRGGPGRPPEAHKALMRELLADPEVDKRLKAVLKAKDDRVFLDSYRMAADRAYGKPAQVIEGGDERKPLVIRLVRESAS